MNLHNITTISYDEIFPIWRNNLWPSRESKIEPNSAMCFLEGYDMYNMSTTPTFFAYTINGEIAGVNSGHMCKDNHYRSRGLFVFEKFRGLGIGTKLLISTLIQGKKEGATMCWSFPRDTSWMTYNSAGFLLPQGMSFNDSETGKNAYCFFQYFRKYWKFLVFP
jgi:GNAT superfamily N-acetyltransferase